MNRQEADGVAILLLGYGLQLACTDRFLLAYEADEALDVGPAQLFVGTREAGQLAHVGVAPAAVPLSERGEVVVVLGDDRLQQALERQRGREPRETLEALVKGAEKLYVLRRKLRRQSFLERQEERPLRRCPPEQDERVVRDSDEGRGEHSHERLVVIAVVQEPQIREEVDDLLLAEVPAPGRAVRRDPEVAKLFLVPFGVGPGSEQEDDLPGRRDTLLDQLMDTPGDVPRLGPAPVDLRACVARLVGDEQLDRRLEGRVREATRRPRAAGSLPRTRLRTGG